MNEQLWQDAAQQEQVLATAVSWTVCWLSFCCLA